MNKKNHFIKIKMCVLLIFISFISSCNDTSNNPIDKPKEFIQFQKGNYWLSVSYNFEVNKIDTMRLEVMGDTLFMNNKWYFLKYAYKNDSTWKSNGLSKGVSVMRLDSNGMKAIVYDTTFKEAIIFKYPVYKGEKYISYNENIEVLNIDTNLILNNKEYKRVIVYKSNEINPFGMYEYFYKRYVCPGIGLIRLEQYQINKSTFKTKLLVLEELFEYKLN